MTPWHAVIENQLERTQRQWQFQRFAQHTATLAAAVSLSVLLFGVAIVLGWMTNTWLVVGCLIALGAVAFFTWALMAMVVAAGAPQRRWLAAALENAHRPLMDRLNTLAYLDETGDGRRKELAPLIEQQAREVLLKTEPPYPFSPDRLVVHGVVFFVLLLTTVLFYAQFHPWRMLQAAGATVDAGLKTPPLDIPADQPAADSSPTARDDVAWGEVRISEPGCDLRLTRLDVVELQIEAAANRPLKQVEWYTAVNGGPDQTHPLPPPEEPKYAVYRPELDLREFGLQEWDVLSYWAKAAGEEGQAWQSDIYFVEIFPFRAELDNLPGGREGPNYAVLKQMTAMVARQQDVIRQAHRLAQLPADRAEGRKKRFELLAAEEADLGRSARHLAADIGNRIEKEVTKDLLDHIEQDRAAFEKAESALKQDQLADIPKWSRESLGSLLETRKQFHQLLREKPEAFSDPDEHLAQADDPAPQREAREHARVAERVDKMQASEKQLQAARDFITSALEEQRTIEQQAVAANHDNHPQLAQRQEKLRQSLSEFVERQSECFQDLQKECSDAQSAMGLCRQALEAKQPNAQQLAVQATDDLQRLASGLQRQRARQRLADAYQCKEMLDRQIERLDGMCRQSGSTPAGSTPAGQKQCSAQDAKRLTDQLKQIAQQPPTNEAFGSALAEALGDEKKQQLDQQADRLAGAKTPDETRQSAESLRQGLRRISQAFSASCPRCQGDLKSSGGSKESGRNKIAMGMRHLESAARVKSKARPMSPQDEKQLREEALDRFEEGLPALYGHNERTVQLLQRLERDLKDDEFPLDLLVVRKLVEEIQSLRRESAAEGEKQPDAMVIQNIDPSRLPPAYRKSIEKYYQKLSERK
ncbi:MAG TPA: hypothetical protein VMV69_14485 [Pirellulales bacterium]|nr:hypothetical protein [Pirellulales bacterium]